MISTEVHSAQKVTPGAPCKINKQTVTYLKKSFTCVKSGQKLAWSKTVLTKKISSSTSPKIESISYTPPSQPSADIELCKIEEKNRNRENPPASLLPTGFPRHTIAQKTGTVKWALIPLDFSDLPGDMDFRSRVDEQMKLTSKWFETVSEGKFKVEWVVLDKWVRLPNPTDKYKIDKSYNLDKAPNGPKLFNDAMTESDKVFNFTGIQTVNFILPNGQDFILESSQGFPWDEAVKNFVTNEGNISSFSIPGKFFDSDKRQYWGYWVHEFGHAMALPHIGSSREANPFIGLDIMGGQDGESRELSGWMRFVAGWLDDEKVYCKQLSDLESTTITLVPLNGAKSGVKMVVVPLTQTKALVIESRRESKFSCDMPSKRNGVLAYLYDATLMHGEDFLKPVTPLGRNPESSSNCPVSPFPNPIIYKGEKIDVEGVTIDVLDSLNYDKIRISKKS